MSIIAHIGKPGSFSHAAARQKYGSSHTYFSCATFEDVCKAVIEDHAEIGVLPIENSLAGSLYENLDLLNTYPLSIYAEQYLRIEHFLLAKKGNVETEKRLEQIRVVYSHPKALDQCTKFFEKHPHMKPTLGPDTSTSAYHVAQSDDLTLAAIGSREAAHLYRLHILASNIEDDRHNYTRFIYVSKKPCEKEKVNKCSLQFEVKHTPGSLVAVLDVLRAHSLNMTKLESRPIHGKPFEYQFYCDFEFSKSQEKTLTEVFHKIEDATQHSKVLGIYEAGTFNM
jgi:prephenate dehydratase